MSSTTILDLNDYCMESIMTYLSLPDKISLTLAIRKFENCLVHFLRKDKFPLKEFINRFDVEQIENTLQKFGSEIRRLYVEGSDLTVPLFYTFLTRYCRKLQEIHCTCAAKLTPELCRQFVRNSKCLHTLSIYGPDSDNDGVSFDILFEDKSKFTHLTNLSLTYLSVSGQHLSNLTNLKHLNIRSCVDLKSEHFMDICRATKLLSIDICRCENLSNAAIETLVQTQTELRSITIGYTYKATNIKLIAQLPELKEIQFISCPIEDIEVYLEALTIHSSQKLEGIFASDVYKRETYSWYSSMDPGDYDQIYGKILKFGKLRQLRFPATYFGDTAFVTALPNACPNLEMLELGSGYKEAADVIQLVRSLKNLIFFSFAMYVSRYYQIYVDLVDAVKERKTCPLKVYCFFCEESKLFFDSMEYKRNMHYVEVLYGNIGKANYSIFNDDLKIPRIQEVKVNPFNLILRDDSDLLKLSDKILRKITSLLTAEDRVKLVLAHERFHSIVANSLKDQRIYLVDLFKYLTYAEIDQVVDICRKYLDKIYFIYKDGLKPTEFLDVLHSYKDDFVEVEVDAQPENFMETAMFLFDG